MCKYFKVNKTALPIIHLIDVIKPGSIDYSLVKQGANLSQEVIQKKFNRIKVRGPLVFGSLAARLLTQLLEFVPF